MPRIRPINKSLLLAKTIQVISVLGMATANAYVAGLIAQQRRLGLVSSCFNYEKCIGSSLEEVANTVCTDYLSDYFNPNMLFSESDWQQFITGVLSIEQLTFAGLAALAISTLSTIIFNVKSKIVMFFTFLLGAGAFAANTLIYMGFFEWSNSINIYNTLAYNFLYNDVCTNLDATFCTMPGLPTEACKLVSPVVATDQINIVTVDQSGMTWYANDPIPTIAISIALPVFILIFSCLTEVFKAKCIKSNTKPSHALLIANQSDDWGDTRSPTLAV